MFKIKDAWQIVEEVSTEGTWTDVRDGQVYPYKQFGNQIWMTVNFNYGGKQGDWVPHTTTQSEGHAWRYKEYTKPILPIFMKTMKTARKMI